MGVPTSKYFSHLAQLAAIPELSPICRLANECKSSSKLFNEKVLDSLDHFIDHVDQVLQQTRKRRSASTQLSLLTILRTAPKILHFELRDIVEAYDLDGVFFRELHQNPWKLTTISKSQQIEILVDLGREAIEHKRSIETGRRSLRTIINDHITRGSYDDRFFYRRSAKVQKRHGPG